MSRHMTARLAWHDNGWDGSICQHPTRNVYCVGGRSLLSDRLRRDRDVSLEESMRGQPFDAKLPEYAPPCYWGINAFGAQSRRILHRHPFADLKDTHTIEDSLPPCSVLTWPFRVSFNLHEETKKRHGNYPPDLEQRINQFFAAHREGQSLVFLYLNYDNPVSGDEPLYAVAGCGLLKEKGKPTRYEFTHQELQQYRAGKGMKHFPEVNWARRLTLDPETVVRLPYHEYVRHVRGNPQDEEKLDEIAVLVTDEALIPSFKYVCDSLDDDQCLFLLYQLRRAVERVGTHGIVSNYDGEAAARLDNLISDVWKRRGAYPGMPAALAYLAQIGEQADEPKEDRAAQMVGLLREQLPDQDLAEEVEKLITSDATPPFLADFRSLVRHAQLAAAEDPELVPQLLRLTQFSLSAFQMERILSRNLSKEKPGPFKHRSVGPQTILENPYALAESYVPSTTDRTQRLKEFERPLRRDGPIGVFHIDAGLFPNADHVNPGQRHNLTPAGPERVRALTLQYLTDRASRHSDSFASLESVHGAIVGNPLFYRSKVTLRPDVLTTPRFRDHFRDLIVSVENAGRTYFYHREIWDAEKLVEETIQELLKRPKHASPESWVPAWIEAEASELAAKIPGFDAKAFGEERSSAIATLLRCSVSILTGRPGSGKTRVLGKLVQALHAGKQSVTVLAPTGKAVLRLSAEAKMQAKTIDKFLHEAWLPEGGIAGVEEVSNDSLKHIGDVRNLIIDESSMLDLPKLATLLRILRKQGLDKLERLILVGDINQLPPIGLGRPFEDIGFWMDKDPKRRMFHVHLETNCRQETGGKILEFAELFVGRNRYYDELLNQVQNGQSVDPNLKVELWKTPNDLVDRIDDRLGELVERTVGAGKAQKMQGLNLLFGLEKNGSVPHEHTKALRLECFQILTPYHSRFAHAACEVNEAVQERYKGGAAGVIGWAQGDKVIRLSNKYDGSELLVSNGTIGAVEVQNGGRARVFFNSRPGSLSMAGEESEEYELAYAITVHKAQGSEFEHVFLVLSSHWPLLTRELVYTALTRSKKTVTLFLEAGEERPLEIALRRSALLGRNSSVFDLPVDKNMLLQPEAGHYVDSKVEYILYSGLMRARDAGQLTFEHHLDLTLDTPSGKKLVKPDFVIETSSGKWILEHLGLLDTQRYSQRWQEKRDAYFAAGWSDRLLTTDDLNGLVNESLEKVINDICAGSPAHTPKSKFSHHHYRLGDVL